MSKFFDSKKRKIGVDSHKTAHTNRTKHTNKANYGKWILRNDAFNLQNRHHYDFDFIAYWRIYGIFFGILQTRIYACGGSFGVDATCFASICAWILLANHIFATKFHRQMAIRKFQYKVGF